MEWEKNPPIRRLLHTRGDSNLNESFTFTLAEKTICLVFKLHENHGKVIILQHNGKTLIWSGYRLENPPLGDYKLTVKGTRHLNYPLYDLDVTYPSMNFPSELLLRPQIISYIEFCFINFGKVVSDDEFFNIDFYFESVSDETKSEKTSKTLSIRKRCWSNMPCPLGDKYRLKYRLRNDIGTSAWSSYFEFDPIKEAHIQFEKNVREPVFSMKLPFVPDNRRTKFLIRYDDESHFRTLEWGFVHKTEPQSSEIITKTYLRPNIRFSFQLRVDDTVIFEKREVCACNRVIEEIWKMDEPLRFYDSRWPTDDRFYLCIRAIGTLEYIEERWVETHYDEYPVYDVRTDFVAKLIEISPDYYSGIDGNGTEIVSLTRIRDKKDLFWRAIHQGAEYHTKQKFMNYTDTRDKFSNIRIQALANCCIKYI